MDVIDITSNIYNFIFTLKCLGVKEYIYLYLNLYLCGTLQQRAEYL